MSFYQPAAFLAGLAIPAILFFYFLRLRRRRHTVSSVFLWERLLAEQGANAPWQRLRKSLSLLLQLLLAALLVFALARPYYPAAAGREQLVVVLLDVSASMMATDVAPNRFEAARREVESLIGELGPGDRMVLIAFGQEPDVLAGATADRQRLREALAATAPGYQQGNPRKALDLALSLARERPGATIVLISDGAGSDEAAGGNGSPPGYPEIPQGTGFFFRQVGKSAFNLAVTNVSVRREGHELLALTSVANFDDLPHQFRVSVLGDGQLLASRTVSLDAGTEDHLLWPGLPAGTAVVTAQIEMEDDLAGDNRAWAVTDPVRSSRVLLISAGNLFLERALALSPAVDVFKIEPEGLASGTASPPAGPGLTDIPAGYDLYVFDGVLPAGWPQGNSLVIGPPAGSPLLDTGELVGVAGQPVITEPHPVMSGVDWTEVYVAAARRVAGNGNWKPVLRAGQDPLLLIGQEDEVRRAVLTFQLAHSNLPLRVAFPLLINNLLAWLLPPTVDLPAGAEPGTLLRLNPPAAALAVDLLTPRGHRLQLAPPFPVKPALLEEPGIYSVLTKTADDGTAGPTGFVETGMSFAVNFPAGEQDIRPREPVPLTATAGDGDAAGRPTNQELWPWFAWIALGLLLAEWWVSARGH